MRISIANQFSRHPAGRDDEDGPHNGTKFRREFLVPALKEPEQVVVDFDGVRTFGTSFLEEAFGGLVRDEGFKRDELGKRLEIVYTQPVYDSFKRLVFKYIAEAKPVKKNKT